MIALGGVVTVASGNVGGRKGDMSMPVPQRTVACIPSATPCILCRCSDGSIMKQSQTTQSISNPKHGGHVRYMGMDTDWRGWSG